MINAYCENLKTAFAQAVHYGVLSEEDAQCFSVQLSIESGFFYLAGGAAILAVLATFVVKAYDQYFRDKDPSAKEALVVADTSDSGFTNTDSDDGEDQAVDAGFSARIEPVPVLFTDTFRWLLRADIAFPSNDHFGRGGEDWILPEARAIAYDKDVDGSVIQGEYLGNQDVDHYNDHDMATADKAKHQYPTASRTTSHRYPAAATARRQLAFDDEYSTMQGSIMDSVSSGSFESSGVRSLISTTGNLKDELTYATPPGGTSRMQSQPARVSASDSQNRPSLALSSGCDVSLSSKSKCHGSAPTSSTSTACEVNSLPSSYCSSKGVSNERRTIQELLDDEEQAFGTPTLPGDAQSEYMEETVDGEEFEEYTVKTMSEILEEDDIFEDYSEYDDQSQKFV